MADGFDRVVPSPLWGHRVFLMASSRGIRSEEVEEIVKTCGLVQSVFESLKVDELKCNWDQNFGIPYFYIFENSLRLLVTIPNFNSLR